MLNLKVALGVAAGLLFGLVWVWLGVAAAFIVLAFALLGLVIGLAVWIGGRVTSGEIDMAVVRQLVAMVFTDTRRDR